MQKGSEETWETNLHTVNFFFTLMYQPEQLRPFLGRPSDGKENEMNGLFVVFIISSDWLNTPSVNVRRTCKWA